MKKRVLILNIVILIALVFFNLPNFLSAQSKPLMDPAVTFLGTKLLPDAEFYGNRDWTNTRELPRQDIGGRLQVFLRNDTGADLAVTGLAVDGVNYASLTSQSSGPVSDTKWWHFWPNPLADGQATILTLRMVDLVADLPDQAVLEIFTSQGTITLLPPTFDPAFSPLWIKSMNFTSDLNTTTLFLENLSTSAITLPANGGFSIDGAPVSTGFPAQQTIGPGETIPMVVTGTASFLTLGMPSVFKVQAQSGEIAMAGLRVFPYTYTVQSHMQGGNYDQLDRSNHYVGDWDDWVREIWDEPRAKGWTPLYTVGMTDDYLNADPSHLDDVTSAHNTSYFEGLIYDDITDIPNSHWGNVRQDLSTYLTAPKPNWYMPQNTWSHQEGLYRLESWGSLEDIQFQSYEATAQGAKSIQWFLFQNHWQQGYGRQEGTDFGRVFQDRYRTGHIANPVMWNYIGRVSGSLDLLEPYLSHSAQYARVLDDNFEINTLVSLNLNSVSAYKGLVMVMDHRTPRNVHAGYSFRYGVPDFNQQIYYDQTFTTTLPTYLYNSVDMAFAVNPWSGVTTIALEKLGVNQVRFTVPILQTGALVVLGTAEDETALNARWDSDMALAFDSYDDARSVFKSQSQKLPEKPWHLPEFHYRQQITITNNGSSSVSTLAIPLTLLPERTYPDSSFRVGDVTNGSFTPIDFFVPGTVVYEDFIRTDTLSRLSIGDIGPTPADGYQVTHDSGAGTVTASMRKYQDGQFAWGFGIDSTGIGPFPWMDHGFPNLWVPVQYPFLSVDVKLSDYPFYGLNKLVVYFDPDMDGNINKSRGFLLRDDAAAQYDLGDGWVRYIYNVEDLFHHDLVYPNDEFTGQYRFGFQSEAYGLWSQLEDQFYPYYVREIRVAGGNQAIVQLDTPLAPAESRLIDVYYDVEENGAHTAPANFNPALLYADTADQVAAVTTGQEWAGLDVQIDGALVSGATYSDVSTLMVRHLKADGGIETQVVPVVNRSFNAALNSEMVPGELLAMIPIQPGGEGQAFVFNAFGFAIFGHVPEALVVPAAWIQDLDVWQDPDQLLFPYSMDLSSDAQYVALGMAEVNGSRDDVTGKVVLLDHNQQIVWEKTYGGRVFFVRFAPDANALYVAAAGFSATSSATWSFNDLHLDSTIYKYDLGGTQLWSHLVGDDTPISSGERGRTVFDMEVYPNGDVLYAEWHSYGVRLDGATADVVWYEGTGGEGGFAVYTTQVVPFADGGGILLGFYTRCLDGNGDTVSEVFMSNEQQFSADGQDCHLWALSGNTVRVIDEIGDFRITPGGPQQYIPPGAYLGRYPRVVRVSAVDGRIAAGSNDGTFALMDAAGHLLWEKRDGASIVTDIAFLPNGAGVAFARQIFDYHQSIEDAKHGWRFRDVVEAYDLQGNALWRHESGWDNEEPFMTQFVISEDGKTMAVLSRNEICYVDLLTTPESNEYLYPVEPNLGLVIPDFSAAPRSGEAPLAVTFTNLSAGDYDACLWTFGDGQTSTDCNDPTHTYVENGTFSVTLTLSSGGEESVRTRYNYILVGVDQLFLPLISRQD